MATFTESNILEQFWDRMRQSEIKPRDSFTPIADGQTHRFAVDGDRGSEKSGAYYLHIDSSWPNFGFMDYHKHGEMQKFKYQPTERNKAEFLEQKRQEQTPQGQERERERQRQENERRKEQEQIRQKEKQETAIKNALNEYMNGSDNWQQHPYYKGRFTDKGFIFTDNGQFSTRYLNHGTAENPDYDYTKIIRYTPKLCEHNGAICRKGELLIPMINIETWEFQSLIHIPPKPDDKGKFQKPYYKGTSPTGSVFALLPDSFFLGVSKNILVAEGFATAIAVMADTGSEYPVFSCGTCNNLKPVCTALRKRYPTSKIIIIADNDKNGTGEKCAKECRDCGVAHAVRIPAVIGYDWYDVLVNRNFKIGVVDSEYRNN